MHHVIINNKDLFDPLIDMLNDFRNNISHCFKLFLFFFDGEFEPAYFTWHKVTRISLRKEFPGGTGH